MATITAVQAQEILDSRGYPTVECRLWLDSGAYVASSSPSGTSRSKFEAHDLRDNDSQRMAGFGVLKAVDNVNSIIGPQLIGRDPTKQTEIDQLLVDLDGSPQKENLGANAILAVSQAVMKAGALSVNMPLFEYVYRKYQLTTNPTIPTCIYTMINGGRHGADNLDIQEFDIIPASHITYPDSLNMAVNLYYDLRDVLISKGAIHSTGLVGGFTPNLFNNKDAFEILIETIKTSQYTFAEDIFFGTDMAASQFYHNGKYSMKDKKQSYSAGDLLDYYRSLRELYHVFYIEDPFDDADANSWQMLTAEVGEAAMVVGDSLLATSFQRVQQAIDNKLCNGVLVKPNQAGTVSETIQVVQLAMQAGWYVIVSHRSGETNDTFVSDLAVGIGAHYIKFGPPNRGERVAKYNHLLEVYRRLQQLASQEQATHDQAAQQAQQAQQTQQVQPAQQAQQVEPAQQSQPPVPAQQPAT
ncbi:MAG: phosphopyruvate hydratase [Candidatus Pacebacteria bacterium CG10_big_fil_rev_8_21_14_0_10_56_10]|nr:MAG: phosphopyruvate hydratase [Candidatus Pacebacteria bacterium CG10_big_fil_rev_8_21_14_0_10_56_10]